MVCPGQRADHSAIIVASNDRGSVIVQMAGVTGFETSLSQNPLQNAAINQLGMQIAANWPAVRTNRNRKTKPETNQVRKGLLGLS